MKTFLLFTLILTILDSPVAGAKTKCNDDVAQMAQGENDEGVIKTEIAKLMIERSRLRAADEAPLRTLFDKNVSQKIGEFKARFGRDLDPEEMKALILQIEGGQKVQKSTEKRAEKKARIRESKALTVTKRIFLEEMGSLHALDSMYFTGTESGGRSHNITGGGVQWSGDERYVAFRAFEKPTRIYDVQTRSFLPYEPATGVISVAGGHVFAENDQDQTTIHDLDSNQVWGPIKGNPVSEFLNDEFIVTQYEIPKAGTSLKDHYHVLHDYKHGRHIDLGSDFSMAADRKTLARAKSKTKIEVLEIATGAVLKAFDCDASKYHLRRYPPGYFTFRRRGLVHFVSMKNLNDVELPFPDEPMVASGDGLKVIYKVQGRPNKKEILIAYDIVTGKQVEIKGFTDVRLSDDRMKALVHRYEGKTTVMFDFNTMTKRVLPGFYDRWSPNSRWVYRSNSDGQWYNHDIYDLVGDTGFRMRSGFDFDFIGQTDFITTETPYLPPAKDVVKTFVNNLAQYNGNPFTIKLGETAAKPSPSGKYMLTYHGSKVELSEFIAK